MEQEIKREELVINLWNSSDVKRKRVAWSIAQDEGVQIVHLPTGTVVTCESERSAHRNKAIAIEELKEILKAT